MSPSQNKRAHARAESRPGSKPPCLVDTRFLGRMHSVIVRGESLGRTQMNVNLQAKHVLLGEDTPRRPAVAANPKCPCSAAKDGTSLQGWDAVPRGQFSPGTRPTPAATIPLTGSASLSG